ncbi:hypothetical protein ACIKT0_01645 [Hansschlegelia beijingensis]|uniref:hypothetical protein n=1 Tax=Hansschlegelia beijingensis TaxID=1133344 RepID=UPI00387F2CFA
MPVIFGNPELDGGLLRIPVTTEGVAGLKSGTVKVRYNDVDVGRVPESILMMPALGGFLTAALALGEKVVVPSVDSVFASAVDDLAKAWKRIYPTFQSEKFELIGPRISSISPAANGDLLLYSGGVDAVASLVKNRSAVAGLFSVWGADVKVNNEGLWRQLQSVVQQTEAVHGLPLTTARTNVRSLIDGRTLVRRFVGDASQTWWMKAQHGIALLALGAPVCYAGGYSRLLIASSHSAAFSEPWGSNPVTDEMVKFANTTCHHDSYEVTRQEKIGRYIAPEIKSGRAVSLAVCYKSSRGGDSINCCKCEKCFRTASALIACGVEPDVAGLPVKLEKLEEWKDLLVSGRPMSENEQYMWSDVQVAAREAVRNGTHGGRYADYLTWLAEHPFNRQPEPETAASYG